jgi:hypothetical protein
MPGAGFIIILLRRKQTNSRIVMCLEYRDGEQNHDKVSKSFILKEGCGFIAIHSYSRKVIDAIS